MRQPQVLVLALLLIFSAFPAHASDFSSAANGTTTADFLSLGVGARAVAMGGAYNAIADDATAMYWNPAGLTNIEDNSISVMHAPYLAGSYFDYAAMGHSLGDYGAIGIGYQYFSLGPVPETDASANSIGTAFPEDFAFTVGYAYKFGNDAPGFLQGFSLGFAGKFIQSRAITAADGEALDGGLLSPGYFDNRLHLALTMDNFGPPLNFGGENENLPLAFNWGGAWQIFPSWLASWNISAPRGGNPYFEAGTEYQIYKDDVWGFFGRAGYDSQTLNNVSGFTGASFGFGIGFHGLAVDYAFTPFGGLGSANRISLGYKF